MSMSKAVAAAATILLVAFVLQGCGRKGPLYMQQIPVKPEPAADAPAEQNTANRISPIQSQPVQTQTESQKQP